MSIGISQVAFNRYETNSATFSITFPRFNENEVRVYVEDLITGELTSLALSTDYTLSNITPAFGSATLTLVDNGNPLPDQAWLDGGGLLDDNTYAIIIEYVPEGKQEVSFANLGRFSPVSFERVLDQLTMTIKAQGRALSRAFKFSRKDIRGGVDADLPAFQTGSAGKILRVNSTGTGVELGPSVAGYFGAVAPRVCHIYEGQAILGGGFSSADPVARVLNTLEGDTGFCSLAANAFTLEVGTYIIEWSAPAADCDRHVTGLYDVTTTPALLKIGSAEFAGNGSLDTVQTRSSGFYYTTITADTDYSIYHESALAVPNGWGYNSVANLNMATESIFTQVKVTKVG